MSDTVTWSPSPERAAASHLARLAATLRSSDATFPRTPTPSFAEIHRWSIDYPEAFWAAVWRDAGVIAEERAGTPPWDRVLADGRMMPPHGAEGPHWFTGARLNFAENLLRLGGGDAAIVSWDETGPHSALSRDALRAEVASMASAFRAMGVVTGDRIAGWLPNGPHAVIAMLATAAIGAIWTSCSPDFGVDGIVDRFGQAEPVVLIFCDGYRYGGKRHDCLARAGELLGRLPTVRQAVMVPWHGGLGCVDDPRIVRWDALIAQHRDAVPVYTRLPFDHPLYILYSSGTTGLPKCMVHGAGGTLLQHLKEHRLHGDVREGERLFYFTTCGWMMWNWLVSGLASGATLVLYDGSPVPPEEPDLLWRMAEEEGIDVFGTSARYLAMAEKHEMQPGQGRPLARLRAILSTGSPLSAASFDWVARVIDHPVQVASISGGTDIVSCFVLGNPLDPVHRGEIQGPGLGMAVDIFDATGAPCPQGVAGELVCTAPFPSMPVGFWNDPDGARYRKAYFARFPGVWCHGDWITRTAHGGFVISGRSDATLNPGGVRIGTAEIYRQVEMLPEIVESLVIGQQIPGASDGDVRVVLFVRLREGISLTPELEQQLRSRIRQGASPHHVPRIILAVEDIPRTRSGKSSELAVRDLVEGRPVENIGALANPESLAHFRNRAELAR